MSLFNSPREKRLWLWALLVLATIYSTLFIGQPLTRILESQMIQFIIFMLGLVLVGVTIIVYGLKTKPRKIEIVLLLGIITVYIMFFLRLGIPERTHLIEYSVLGIFIHEALLERNKQDTRLLKTSLLAIVITVLLGVIDESLQLIIPNRVFDPVDILFNSLAAFIAIGYSSFLRLVKKFIASIRHYRNLY